MAKGKKGKKAGGKKKASAASGSGRLESRLLGYWKKGLYGEFVTAFLRQRHRALQTKAAELWDPAVYSLLDHALFRVRDPSLLEEFLPQLRQDHHLSEQTRSCLAIAEAANDLYRGEASLEQLTSLPQDPPGPFAELREYLARIPGRARDSSSLAEYADKRRKNARRGEKHLAETARFSRQLSQVLSAPIRECSTTPLTRMRNKLREVRDTVRDIRGSSSPALTDAAALSDLLRELKARPMWLSHPEDALDYLEQRGITYSSHPFARDLWQVVLRLGGQIQGKDWERSLRLDLWPRYPDLLPGLPDHLREQLAAREDSRRRGRMEFGVPIRALAVTLEYNVWSRRERIVLLWALLSVQLEFASEIEDLLLHQMNLGLDADQVELGKAQIADQIFDTGMEFLSLIRELAPGRSELMEKVMQKWTAAVALLPPPQERDRLTALADMAVRLPVDPSVWLVLLMKGSEAYDSEDKDPVLARIRDNVAPFSLEEDAFSKASSLLSVASRPGEAFKRWTHCLDSPSLCSLAGQVLDELFQDTLQPRHPRSKDLWLLIPKDFLRELARFSGEEHPLLGLARLTLNKANRSTPLPENEKEAEVFLSRIPPEDTLYSILLWMLGYPRTASSDAFLHRIIIQLADYATREESWGEIALALLDHGSTGLASRVWDSWEELGLMESESEKEDFRDACRALRTLTPKGKGGAGSRKKNRKRSPKQKSLLDGDVQKGNKKRNQGKK